MLSIQELFLDVHQPKVEDAPERKNGLHNRALHMPSPAKPKSEYQVDETSKTSKKMSVLDIFQGGSPREIDLRLQNIPYEVSQELEAKYSTEIRKPGSGLLTMDFVTMGMFILGMSMPKPKPLDHASNSQIMANNSKMTYSIHPLANPCLELWEG